MCEPERLIASRGVEEDWEERARLPWWKLVLLEMVTRPLGGASAHEALDDDRRLWLVDAAAYAW